jgi:NAD(P)H-flavin reductase
VPAFPLARDLPDDWSYSTGYIDEPMLREHLLEAGEGALCAMCGPPGMIDFACVPNLTKLGFTEAQMVLF